MVGIYFKTTELPVRYLIYIAMTALGRVLIEMVGAEHRTGNDLLIVAGAILVLSLAVLVLRLASPGTIRPTNAVTDLGSHLPKTSSRLLFDPRLKSAHRRLPSAHVEVAASGYSR